MTTATDFVLRVRDIARKPGESREFSFQTSFGDRVGEGIAWVDGDAQVRVEGMLESVHEGILATGRSSVEATGECSRCLNPLTLELEIDFGELFAYDRSEDFELFVIDESVDLEEVVRDAAVLALPFQPVCRPDCAGLNPETGERLAPGTQWTSPERIDPRWAALQEFKIQDHDPAPEAGDQKE